MKPTASEPETDPRFPSGPWEGFWIQKYEPRGKHQTELHLHFSQGVMTGEGRDVVGKYLVRGRYDVVTGRCHWSKRYVGKHDVAYDGFNEGKGIWGTWSIESLGLIWKGGFHIWPKGMLDPTGQTLHAEADIEVEEKERIVEAQPLAVP